MSSNPLFAIAVLGMMEPNGMQRFFKPTALRLCAVHENSLKTANSSWQDMEQPRPQPKDLCVYIYICPRIYRMCIPNIYGIYSLYIHMYFQIFQLIISISMTCLETNPWSMPQCRARPACRGSTTEFWKFSSAEAVMEHWTTSKATQV